MTRTWEKLYWIMGDNLFVHIFKYYLIFQRSDSDDTLIQICGTNLFEYLHEHFGKNSLYEQLTTLELNELKTKDGDAKDEEKKNKL